jgi:hypothetical protein
MPLLDTGEPGPYGETRDPSRFGNASPLDPQLFIKADEFAGLIYEGKTTARYSPLEVAQWLDGFSDRAEQELSEARKKADLQSAAFRRLDIDVRAEIGLARFYAGKMRAALLLALFERSGDQRLLDAAVNAYEKAREGWAFTADATKLAYRKDLTFGRGRQQRGHWSDRLPDIEKDIATLKRAKATVSPKDGRKGEELLAFVQRPPTRSQLILTHTASERFARGQMLDIVAHGSVPGETMVTLCYRHAHQAEAWREMPMTLDGETCRAAIPAAYTETLYPITYYFEISGPNGDATISPGLGEHLDQMPYYVSRPVV